MPEVQERGETEQERSRQRRERYASKHAGRIIDNQVSLALHRSPPVVVEYFKPGKRDPVTGNHDRHPLTGELGWWFSGALERGADYHNSRQSQMCDATGKPQVIADEDEHSSDMVLGTKKRRPWYEKNPRAALVWFELFVIALHAMRDHSAWSECFQD